MRNLSDSSGQILGSHACEMQWNLFFDFLIEIVAEPPAARAEMIDRDNAFLDLARVANIFRNKNAMINDANRRPPTVPHQRIKWSHMHKQHIGIVHNMFLLGRMIERWIMLNINARQLSLRFG